MTEIPKEFDEGEKAKWESGSRKASRIKFKRTSLTLNERADSSAPASVRNLFKESSISISKTSSQELSQLFDVNHCYHRDCCFAYNVAGNVKRPSLITECMPQMTYQRLAQLWGLDPEKTPRVNGNTCKIPDNEDENNMVEEFIKNVGRDLGMQSDVSEDLIVNPSFQEESLTSVKPEAKSNPYIKFLKDLEAMDSRQKTKSNLGKKAGKITKMIISNFLEWYQSLGGNDGDTFIEESTLLELFQIGFDMPAAKALAISIKEMPTVPESLALLRNEPTHSTRYGLRKFLEKDIQMENIPTRMFAFGSMLPKERPTLRYKPPRNFVQQTWMECSRVPKDLDSMKTIWVGLEKLRSTIAFSNWLKNHPEVTPPKYLQDKGLLKINYEEWNQIYKGFETDVDNVEVVMSDLKILQEKSSLQSSKFSEGSARKSESMNMLYLGYMEYIY